MSSAIFSSLSNARAHIQSGKSALTPYSQTEAEDKLLELSEDPRNERHMEHLINPATGGSFTDAQIQQAIENAQLRQDIAAAEDSLLELSMDPQNADEMKDVINPETGQAYTDAEIATALDNASERVELQQENANEEAKENIEEMYPLGSLSELYETGNNGPGTIANNRGDIGGASYGTYQIATNTGTMNNFLNSSFAAPYAAELGGLSPGSAEFNQKWTEIAQREPEKFELAQHDFIQSTHYDPAAQLLLNQHNFDVSDRSRALQNVVWSVSVQHGGGVPPIVNAFNGVDINSLTDDQIITMIYDERGKLDANGELYYFSANSQQIQQSVANRFVNEHQDALAALDSEAMIYEDALIA